MNLQNVAKIVTPDGEVKTIQNSNGDLLWGKVNYSVKYSGDSSQDGIPTPSSPVPIKVVSGEDTIKITGKNICKYVPKTEPSQGLSSTYDAATGVVHVTGTATTTWSDISATVIAPIEAGTYTYRTEIVDGSFSSNISLRTMSSGGSTVQSWIYTAGSTHTGALSSAYSYRIYIKTVQNATYDFKFRVQLEKSNTASVFEPYREQVREVNLGKNLLQIDPPSTAQQGLTTTYDSETGIVNVSGTTTSTYANISNRAYNTLPAGTYTFSVSNAQSQMNINLRTYYADGTYTNRSISAGSTSVTFTDSKSITSYYAYVWNNSWSSTDIDATFSLQLESGDNSTSFAPYFTPIELCKIGAYQDYIYKSGGKWYVRKEIGKSTLSAEGYTKWMTHPDACIYYRNSIPSSALFGDYGNTMACQYYDTVNQVADVTTFYNNTTSKSYAMSLKFGTAGIAIKDTRFTTAAQLHAWLAENPTVIYYALATTTDTEITNQALTAQLSIVEQLLTRYGYDATVTGNLPIIIDRTAL